MFNIKFYYKNIILQSSLAIVEIILDSKFETRPDKGWQLKFENVLLK